MQSMQNSGPERTVIVLPSSRALFALSAAFLCNPAVNSCADGATANCCVLRLLLKILALDLDRQLPIAGSSEVGFRKKSSKSVRLKIKSALAEVTADARHAEMMKKHADIGNRQDYEP